MADVCGDILDETGAYIFDEANAYIWDELGPCDHSGGQVRSAGGIFIFDDEDYEKVKRSRRRRKDLVNAEEALKAALNKASELKKKPREALKEAVAVAKIAIDLPGILSGEIAPLTQALEAATEKVDAWELMLRAAHVRAIANELIRKTEREKRQREEDDDEEALMMLGF